MPLQVVNMLPGISKADSPYAESKVSSYVAGRVAQGRYTDGQNIRFVAGSPEKLGGWISIPAYDGEDTPRALLAYRDSNVNASLVIATETHLYTYVGTTLTDITPLRAISIGTLTNALTTTAGSGVVAVADSSQTLQNGDHVFLSASAAIGGLTVNGWYTVSGRTGTGYNITLTTTAASAVSGAGGTISFQYPRVTLANPFATTNLSYTVTVTHANHGAVADAYVVFSGGASVGGITISGEYQIVSVVDANHYTISVANAATSTATGGGSVSVIYPIPLNIAQSSSMAGWGASIYGVGPFGASAFTTTTAYAGWHLASYGNILAAAPIGGTAYFYDAAAGGRAYPLLNAPSSMLAMFITRERFIVALGINGNYLEIAWCDQVDPTQWTSAITNTANSGRSLIGGNFFVGGVVVRDQIALLWTDKVLFQMSYSGDNNVYDTSDVGDNCGLIGPHACCAEGETAYWMSATDFWMWNGTPQQLDTDDIREFVFGNLNVQYAWKSVAGVNQAKREVWFHFPSLASTENDSCVIYHYDQQCWSVGAPPRSAWVDAQLFFVPFATSSSGILYQHETGLNADQFSMYSSLEASPFDISNGSQNVDVAGFVPDFERISGAMTVTIYSQYYTQDVMNVDGPYTITPPVIGQYSNEDQDTYGGGTPTHGKRVTTAGTERIDLRTDGKLIGFQIASNTLNGDFRLGLIRFDAQPSGARR